MDCISCVNFSIGYSFNFFSLENINQGAMHNTDIQTLSIWERKRRREGRGGVGKEAKSDNSSISSSHRSSV